MVVSVRIKVLWNESVQIECGLRLPSFARAGTREEVAPSKVRLDKKTDEALDGANRKQRPHKQTAPPTFAPRTPSRGDSSNAELQTLSRVFAYIPWIIGLAMVSGISIPPFPSRAVDLILVK